jgi:tRNA 5-methylaminomethyl-2-thiouridine biosynthesis bifunctional protein
MTIAYTKLRWDEKGLPHSVDFNDKYFCEDNGYEESQYIFSGGNNLKERFSGLLKDETFVIGETGFGTGLNFLCAWELFESTAPSQAKLHYISLDQFPLSPDDLKRALGLWPQLKSYATELVLQYPKIDRHNLSVTFESGRITLTLIFDHVLNALARMRESTTTIDAWFLDGFAPSKNTDMWSVDVFKGLASLSKPKTTIATFTVAGHVRRGLMEAGFVMTKAPGYGKKLQMLKGIYH